MSQTEKLRLTIIIGREKMFECAASADDAEKKSFQHEPMDIRVENHPREKLVGLIGPSKEGRLFTTVHGRSYKIISIQSDGTMRLIPKLNG